MKWIGSRYDTGRDNEFSIDHQFSAFSYQLRGREPERNCGNKCEVTHDKDLPSIEGSKIFLLSYIRPLKSIKSLSTYLRSRLLRGSVPSLWIR
jgi:hypothetical protein